MNITKLLLQFYLYVLAKLRTNAKLRFETYSRIRASLLSLKKIESITIGSKTQKDVWSCTVKERTGTNFKICLTGGQLMDIVRSRQGDPYFISGQMSENAENPIKAIYSESKREKPHQRWAHDFKNNMPFEKELIDYARYKLSTYGIEDESVLNHVLWHSTKGTGFYVAIEMLDIFKKAIKNIDMSALAQYECKQGQLTNN